MPEIYISTDIEADGPIPGPHSMLELCVRRQDDSRRITLSGLISAIRALETPAFPLVFPELCVFLQLTECRGPGEARIEIQHADSSQIAFRTRTRRIQFGNDPLEIYGVSFRIRDCVFNAPGLYWVQFWYNNEVISCAATIASEVTE